MQLNLGINNIKVIVYLSYLPAAACFTALYGWRVLILFRFLKEGKPALFPHCSTQRMAVGCRQLQLEFE